MTKAKRLLALLLAAVMLLSGSVTAFGATFKKTKVELPDGVKDSNVVAAVDGIWKTLSETALPLINENLILEYGLTPFLSGAVYTNATVGKIYGIYYKLCQNEDVGPVLQQLFTATNLAASLKEEKFAAAKAKIEACIPYGNQALGAIAMTEFVSGDFGFNDGDRDGFENALLAVLRPISKILAANAKSVYKAAIPFFDQLGCRSLPTPDVFMADYRSAKEEKGATIGSDEILRPIFDSIFNDLLPILDKKPLNGLLKLLPRIAYTIDTGIVNDTVKAVLTYLGFGSLNVDLSKEKISELIFRFINNNILGGMINTKSVKSKAEEIQAMLDNNETPAQEQLYTTVLVIDGFRHHFGNQDEVPQEERCEALVEKYNLILIDVPLFAAAPDWAKLANCADEEMIDSADPDNGKVSLRTGDVSACFTTLFYYIYDLLLSNSNYPITKGIIEGLISGKVGEMVIGYTDRLNAAGRVGAYGMILDVFGDVDKTEGALQTIGDAIAGINDTLNFAPFNAKSSKVKMRTALTYTGKIQKPAVKVIYRMQTLVKGKDYSVKYSKGCRNVGIYKVKIIFKGSYTGRITKTFTIAPKRTNISSLRAAKTAVTARWNKQAVQTTGYQVELATDKKFTSDVKRATLKKLSKKFTGLKSKSTYYARVRTYKTVNGTKIYSKWSKVLSVKTK